MAEPAIHRYGADRDQFGELWLPEGRPAAEVTVVLLHGGFWRAARDLSRTRPLAADLAGRGYAAWNLEYRRAGAGGGWPATFEDVAAGIDALAALDVAASRVVAIGHSAGGHLAAWAAARSLLPAGAPGAGPLVGLTGAISLGGVVALADCARDGQGEDAALEFMGGPPDLLPAYRLADPMSLLPAPVPVTCLHSRADDRVPFAYSERYVAAATAAGGHATLVETGGTHQTLVDPHSPDWAATLAALSEISSFTITG